MGRSFQNKDILKKVYLQDYNLVVARLLLETLSSRNTDGDTKRGRGHQNL